MNLRNNIENFLEYLGDAVLLINSEAEIAFANSACLSLFEYPKEDLLDNSINILVEQEHRSAHINMVKAYINKASEPKRMTSRPSLLCTTKNGKPFYAKISISTMNIEGELYGIAIIQDDTQAQELAAELEKKAITDSLTLLYNRRYLDSVMLPDNRWVNAHAVTAVLYLDLDEFKPLNDKYGHACGDFVLKSIAQRMKSTLRQKDIIFRVGGDEFIVMLSLDNNEQQLKVTKSIAKKLHREITRPIKYKAEMIDVGLSIGVCLYPCNFNDLEVVIKIADKAMYFAKQNNQAIAYAADLPKV